MSLGATSIIGVLTALLGTVLLALGAFLQHRGLAGVREQDRGARRGALTFGQLFRLPGNRRWLGGVSLTVAAMALNLLSLRLAPLIVVQPLGVVALITTALLNAAAHAYRLTWASVGAMALCVAGIGTFVTVGALTARHSVVSDSDLGQILTVLGVAAVVLAAGIVLLRGRFPATLNVLTAGVLSGFVVALAKTVVTRVSVGDLGWLTVVGLVALIAVAATSQYFVQSAYTSGPVDLIVAGMTIIDPLVAVSLGVLVLGEAAGMPGWASAAQVLSGTVAIAGVILLSRSHPQAVR
ncbi:DMT family transporter [Naasia sp. SYSU D00057]|uniref:DMT family transporter n=1 Tax=Naasia sp. SYSU D00057 TaxID=2817380 RepID=UPI001B3139B9|nr:DMT family transporter [Naasia sp. SYSU D00057]